MDIDSDPGATPGGSGDRLSFRLRRRHQKSRRGCLECKRRHMKCDETRPRCLNCTTVERTCSYTEDNKATNVGGAGTQVISRASSSGAENLKSLTIEERQLPGSHSPTPVPHMAAHSPYHLQQPPTAPTHSYHHHPPEEEEPEEKDAQVNMVHMQLFQHFLSSNYGFVEPEQPISRLVKQVAVRRAVSCPFLMHQLLAFSARHRGSITTSSPNADDDDNSRLDGGGGAYFRHLATQLQTRAISLFGRIDLNTVTLDDRVSIFLFSSFLGFQDLCDALSLQASRFQDFHERWLAYARLHRGVHTVIRGSWEMLRASELRPVLDEGEKMYNASGSGPECDDLKARIEGSVRLDGEEKEACRFAIKHLQWVFDARPNYRSRVNVMLAWVAMFSDKFLELLVSGRGEALCILGYYFVLLHLVRDVWFVYQSGEALLGLLGDYLGSEWEEWLVRPRELIRRLGDGDLGTGDDGLGGYGLDSSDPACAIVEEPTASSR